jgi:hypothetical protein
VRYLAAVAPLVLLAPVIYVVEQRIVTERERVESSIYEVISAFERNDIPEMLRHITANDEWLRRGADRGMQLVHATGPINVTDIAVTLRNQESRATSRFRANGPIEAEGFGDVGHRPSRWEVTWQKEGGEWRIIGVERLDPINGEPMDLFAASERAGH